MQGTVTQPLPKTLRELRLPGKLSMDNTDNNTRTTANPKKLGTF